MKTQRIHSSTNPAAERIKIGAITICLVIGIAIALAWIGGIAHGQEAHAPVAPKDECYREEMRLDCSPSSQFHDCVGVFHCEPDDCCTGSMHRSGAQTDSAVTSVDCLAHVSYCGGVWHDADTALPCHEAHLWPAPHFTVS